MIDRIEDSDAAANEDETTRPTRIRKIVFPRTFKDLCRVSWPAVAALLFTILALVIARTRPGRWFITEMPLLPRMATWRWQVVVAVVATEGGLVIGTLKNLGIDPLRTDWTPIILHLVVLHVVAFLPVIVVLLSRWIRGPRPWYDDPSDIFIVDTVESV